MRKRLEALRLSVINENGATAVEYGLIAGLIAVALIGAIVATGGATESMWDYVSQQYKAVSGG